MTLTEDSDSGLRLVRNAKKFKKDPCGGGVTVFLCDNKAYPSLEFDFDFDFD